MLLVAARRSWLHELMVAILTVLRANLPFELYPSQDKYPKRACTTRLLNTSFGPKAYRSPFHGENEPKLLAQCRNPENILKLGPLKKKGIFPLYPHAAFSKASGLRLPTP